jgi:pilus assembly protein Flp/PilA
LQEHAPVSIDESCRDDQQCRKFCHLETGRKEFLNFIGDSVGPNLHRGFLSKDLVMGIDKARVFQDERGVSAVEYGLIAALIVLAMVAGLSQVATATTTMWNNVSETFEEAGD